VTSAKCIPLSESATNAPSTTITTCVRIARLWKNIPSHLSKSDNQELIAKLETSKKSFLMSCLSSTRKTIRENVNREKRMRIKTVKRKKPTRNVKRKLTRNATKKLRKLKKKLEK